MLLFIKMPKDFFLMFIYNIFTVLTIFIALDVSQVYRHLYSPCWYFQFLGLLVLFFFNIFFFSGSLVCYLGKKKKKVIKL